MSDEPTGVERLIPALPPGEIINEPEDIDRLLIRVLPDGTISFRGPRARIEELLALCAEEGLIVRVDHLALCG